MSRGRRRVDPDCCVNCGGIADVPSVDNKGNHYLGCRRCTVVLDDGLAAKLAGLSQFSARPGHGVPCPDCGAALERTSTPGQFVCPHCAPTEPTNKHEG